MNNILIFGMTENPGGVESFLMSYIRKINRGNFKFDFLCNFHEDAAYEDELIAMGGKVFHITARSENYRHDKIAYEDELISYGCEIYHITARSKDYKKYKREMQQFFKENASQYDTIWVNVCSLANIDYLKYAKKYGIKRRIIHSHNSMNMDSKLRGLLHAYNKRHIDKYATDFWACSKEAGEWFYSKQIMQGANYKEIKNAIDISQYKYDEDIRIAYRKKYGVEDKFVIGNVGRLQFQKNQLFLLDIFASVLKKKPEAILWMIGQGEDEDKIREKIQKLNLGTAVKMLGVRNDVPNLLQAMDVFVFPSVFEGLGIALLEAQATGLTCIASKDVIPEEVKVTPQLQFVSLEESAEVWADRILNAEYCEKRDTLFQLAMKAGYDINTEVGRLETLLGEKR